MTHEAGAGGPGLIWTEPLQGHAAGDNITSINAEKGAWGSGGGLSLGAGRALRGDSQRASRGSGVWGTTEVLPSRVTTVVGWGLDDLD